MEVIIALENLRSLHNIGAIYRTSEFLGVKKIFLIGYSAFDPFDTDTINKKLIKTSLGTLNKIQTKRFGTFKEVFDQYKSLKFAAIEQSSGSINLKDYKIDSTEDLCLVFGNEVEGLKSDTLQMCNDIIEIPSYGSHKSLNVATSVGIVLWHVTSQKNDKRL